MADTPLSSAIETAATSPLEVQTDAGRVKGHTLDEMIVADKYLAGKAGVDKPKTRGLRFTKLVPPGAP